MDECALMSDGTWMLMRCRPLRQNGLRNQTQTTSTARGERRQGTMGTADKGQTTTLGAEEGCVNEELAGRPEGGGPSAAAETRLVVI